MATPWPSIRPSTPVALVAAAVGIGDLAAALPWAGRRRSALVDRAVRGRSARPSPSIRPSTQAPVYFVAVRQAVGALAVLAAVDEGALVDAAVVVLLGQHLGLAEQRSSVPARPAPAAPRIAVPRSPASPGSSDRLGGSSPPAERGHHRQAARRGQGRRAACGRRRARLRRGRPRTRGAMLHFTIPEMHAYMARSSRARRPLRGADHGADAADRPDAHAAADLRPGGSVSGPAIFALADCAFYMATLAMIGRTRSDVTRSCAIDSCASRRPAPSPRRRESEARPRPFGRRRAGVLRGRRGGGGARRPNLTRSAGLAARRVRATQY